MQALLPYQNEGVAFLAERSRALLGDDAGLGKSVQTIRAAEKIGAERILILCPAVGRVSWQIQFQEWDRARRPVYTYPDGTAGLFPDGPLALILSYDWAANRRRFAALRRMYRTAAPFDVAIMDEAHFLTNPDAQRTGHIYGLRPGGTDGLIADIPYLWAVTATFTPLHAGQLYSHLLALLPDTLRSLFRGRIPTSGQFTQRFCHVEHTPYGDRVRGNRADAIPALREAIRPHLLLRQKKDVEGQIAALGPVLSVLLPLDVPAPAEDAGLDALSDDELLAWMARGFDPDSDEGENSYSAARRELGEAKAVLAAQWAAEFLDADPARKLVIFAHHRSVIELLTERLKRHGSVSIHGGTSHREVVSAVTQLQTNNEHRVLVGQTRAAGTSITLTAANTVLIVEPDPSPSANYQAISRCHRIGQSEPVTAYFAYAASHQIDRRLAQIVRRRALDNQQLFGVEARGAVPLANVGGS